MYFDVIIAGFGGQGVMFIGNLLAVGAMNEGRMVTYMPVYGVEMRGGTANCTVVVADEEIGSPIVQNPVSAIIMNKPSLVKFGPRVQKNGLMAVNTSLIEPEAIDFPDVATIHIPAMELAAEVGNDRLANMIMLGAVVAKTGVIKLDGLIEALPYALDERYHKMIPANTKALERGAEFIRQHDQA
ncbi:MAG: 2-oxoacid:acceptor oxidoreductase family protein [Deltaproteobacteria bacterium]|nr:2-oxoacid:acceptor oxidoreductase family protein [Deltaproteobacteria bacterium]